MGQEVQVRISDINTDNNTVNLSMVPAGAYDDRSGGGYGKGGTSGLVLFDLFLMFRIREFCCPIRT